MSLFPHTDRTRSLLRHGDREHAIQRHNERVTSELERATRGEVINLSDLMAAREELLVRIDNTQATVSYE